MAKALQLKIVVKDSKPPIWRRFLVPESITFHKLHQIIQIVMGWENYHLYEFSAKGLSIQKPDEDTWEEVTDSRKIRLGDVVKAEKFRFYYMYDFGDGWEHSVIVEKILEAGNLQLPLCIAGKMACPAEDSGGIWGYQELLEIKRDKNHPRYRELIVNWLGEDFDPEKLDIDSMNRKLNKMI